MTRILLAILCVLVAVPTYSGEARLALMGDHPTMRLTPVLLDRTRPGLTRVGQLEWLGGLRLTSDDPAFGGFSSLSTDGRRFVLLSDGGNIVRFDMPTFGQFRDLRFGDLPDGPGSGWRKANRDSESMSVDRQDGSIWVGFENANALWHYRSGFTGVVAHVAPPVMAHWPANEGPEAMTLWPGHGMAVIAETEPWPGRPGRGGVVFTADPVTHPNRGFRFSFVPPDGYDPSDMTILPDGRIAVLVRRLALPFSFEVKLMLVDPRRIAPDAVVHGREIAALAPPLIHDNFEGVAATRENGAIILWLVSDDNQSILQRSLLLKFRLLPDPPAAGR